MAASTQSFEELLASVASAHKREVELLQTELQGLRAELAQAKGGAAPSASGTQPRRPPELELDAPAQPSQPIQSPVSEPTPTVQRLTPSNVNALTILLPGCVGDAPKAKSSGGHSEASPSEQSSNAPEVLPVPQIKMRKASTVEFDRNPDRARTADLAAGSLSGMRRDSKFRTLSEQPFERKRNSGRSSIRSSRSRSSGGEVGMDRRSDESDDTGFAQDTPVIGQGGRRRTSLGVPTRTPPGGGFDADKARRRQSLSASATSLNSSMSKASNRPHRRSAIRESVHSVMQAFVKELENSKPVIESGTIELSTVWAELRNAALEGQASGRLSIVPIHSGSINLFQRRTRQPSIEYMVEHARQRSINNLLRCFVVAPSSRWRLMWDVAGVGLLVSDMIMVPLQFFPVVTDGPGIRGFQMAAATYWTVDIVASFFVGYHFKGSVVVDPLLIAMRYLKSWFLLDLSIVVMDWTFQGFGESTTSTWGRVSRAIRAVRLLRVAKLHTLLSEVNIKVRIKSELTRTLLGIVRIILVILILNHFIACGFYGLHYVMEERNWVQKTFQPQDGFGYRYWTCMHWSLTQFTPASMEVVPVNALERCYTVTTLLLALVCFSSFVSSITSAMTRYGYSNLRQQQQTAALYRFLGQRNISTALVNRVWHYLHDRNEMVSQARACEDEVELIKVLPESLKIDLRHEIYMPALMGHPLFREYGQLEPQAVRHICKSAIKEHTLSIREELFGDCVDVTHMVFVTEGMLEYSYPAKEEEKEGRLIEERIGAGQWACELALWATSLSLVGPFVAAMKSYLMLVSVAEFVVVARRFPGSVSLIAEYADMFLEYAREESKDCRWACSLCNNNEAVQDLVVRAVDFHVHACGSVEVDDGRNRGSRRSSFSGSSTSSTESTRRSKKGLWSYMTGGMRGMVAGTAPMTMQRSTSNSLF